jgi:chemotaxis protein methyltransferase CheR
VVQPDDFEFLARLLKERSGLVLTKDKGYLVENRLMPLVRKQRLRNVVDMVAALRGGEPALAESVVEAMMAKDTGFFRDWKPFQHFRNVVLPNLLTARKAKRAFRVLCAGVSTGQEAYSLAMILSEYPQQLDGWQVEILGIDLSSVAIAVATSGLYSQFDVQRGLPIRALLKYFQKEDDSWRLAETTRSRASFKPWNLLDDLFPLGRFDVVLCRNVLPYFDMQTKFSVLQKLSRSMTDDSVLYVGVQEALSGVSTSFHAVDVDLGIYKSQRPDVSKTKTLAIPNKN